MVESDVFQSVHRQVIQEARFKSLLASQIESERANIDVTVRKLLSSLRSFCLFDIWYSRLNAKNGKNAAPFLESSIYKREGRRVYGSPADLPYDPPVRERIAKFCRMVPRHMPIVLRCINEYLGSVLQSNPRPPPFVPGDSCFYFFVFSTFPSLFGYGWCIELGSEQVHAICDLIVQQLKATRGPTTVEFTKSYARELVRQFCHMAGIQRFFQLSLANEFYMLLVDEQQFDKVVLFSGADASVLKIVIKYAKRFVDRMVDSLPKMPALVRYLFARAFAAAEALYGEDSKDALALLEDLFLEGLIRSALLDPKLYGLIPETATATSICGAHLLRIIRWRLHLKDGRARIDERFIAEFANDPTFEAIRVGELLHALGHFDARGVEGLSIEHVQKVAQLDHFYHLTSVNDVLFLAQAIAKTIDGVGDAPELKAACDLSVNLEGDELIEFWDRGTTLPEGCLRAPPSRADQVPTLTLRIFDATSAAAQTPDDGCIRPLISYLQAVPPAPAQTLVEFIRLQQQRAQRAGDTDLLRRTVLVGRRLAQSGLAEADMLSAVRDVVRRRVAEQAHMLATAFHVQANHDNLRKIERDAAALSRDLEPIIHLSVVRSFLASKEGAAFEREAAAVDAWGPFFVRSSQEFARFIEKYHFDPTAMRKLLRQLHARFTERLPVKLERTAKDVAMEQKYEELMVQFMNDAFSKPLQRIFETPACFDGALEMLRTGTSIGTPLERLTKICECVDVLQDIYLFEANEGCPGDDFLPLFLFALLNAKLKNLWSISSYLRTYVMDIEEQVKILDSREKYVATSFLSSVDHIAGQV
jgi:hypothetical protein